MVPVLQQTNYTGIVSRDISYTIWGPLAIIKTVNTVVDTCFNTKYKLDYKEAVTKLTIKLLLSTKYLQ